MAQDLDLSYLMQAFVSNGFKNTDLKSLNFVRKFIQAVTLPDIATTDGNCIFHQSYNTVKSNGLREVFILTHSAGSE